ncbi:unnamed protein product [Oppiella nova]|uniref:C2H2-type domain-containing protein n=1 Tax=Oppiella nova TaxID=334625 RepID=A0A7R9MUT3_9ACAR|nr:unnamed protein product [Oppiella nova]CAG2184016.1 unnamed protein product [Oppiella nova]
MFKCNQCTLEFDKYSKLLIHRNRHFGEKKFKCWDQFPDCKWSFFTIGELRNHQLWSHSKEQNFVCDWSDCGKKFKLRNLLGIHSYTLPLIGT